MNWSGLKDENKRINAALDAAIEEASTPRNQAAHAQGSGMGGGLSAKRDMTFGTPVTDKQAEEEEEGEYSMS